MPEAPPGSKASVHVTMLLNFFEEVKRRETVESRRSSRSQGARARITGRIGVGPSWHSRDRAPVVWTDAWPGRSFTSKAFNSASSATSFLPSLLDSLRLHVGLKRCEPIKCL